MQKKFLLGLSLCMAALYGCDENNSGSSYEEGTAECHPVCHAAEKCVDGKCLCGDKACGTDETCVEDKCVKSSESPEDACKDKTCKEGERCEEGKCLCGDKECDNDETCVNDECTKSPAPEEDPCKDKMCREGEHCEEGKCLCGDEECGESEICSEGECVAQSEQEKCGESICIGEETCVDSKCMCGTEECVEGQNCVDGKCLDDEGGDGGEDDEDIKCTPECGTDEVCESGKCVKAPTKCNPECGENEDCVNGQCKQVVDSCDNLCGEGLTCKDGNCLCGSVACTEEQVCKSAKCEWIDPCHEVKCNAGETCVSGKCKTFGFMTDELDVMMSSVSKSLVAKRSGTKALTWSFGDNLKDWMIMCKVEKNDYKAVLKNKDVKACIVVDKEKNTESVQFVGIGRHAKDLKVSVTDGTLTSDAVLHLKPYFDDAKFVNLRADGVKAEKKLIYRNGVCPGNYISKDKYSKYNESTNEYKANLGGDSNPYGRTAFTEEDTKIIDTDLYNKYVKPKMLCQNGSCYGTRASVVAAARFLVLQFPYDIPYNMDNLANVTDARSHYIWNEHENLGTGLLQNAIYGLNLDSNEYNSKHEVIGDHVIPWGQKYEPAKRELNDSKKNNEFAFNGLKCSGFVTWSFRNGRLGLGSWNSSMFAKQGYCYADENDPGTVKRNFRCKDLVNNTAIHKSIIEDDGKYKTWSTKTSSNQNNIFNAVYTKLNRLKDADFVNLKHKSESEIKKIFKDVKAGDILWQGKCIDKDCKYTKDGHVAFILGIKKKNGEVTEIEVAEAVSKNGNRLNRYTPAQFLTKAWVTGKRSDGPCNSFVIKMDNVYNYYSDKYDIKTESKTSDCPNNVKSGGNCYNYTDTYNDAFNDALKMQ